MGKSIRKSRRGGIKVKKYTVVDLFCGAGGLSRGFLDASYEYFDVVLDSVDSMLKSFEIKSGIDN